jgi:mRNA interferase RelE/StbE
MYRILITHEAEKEIKKQGQPFKVKIEAILQELCLNPYPPQTEKLSGVLGFLYSLHFSHSGTAFRLAYQVNKTEKTITIVQIGPRENFYEKLRRKLN